jgi:hypothetical protein
MENYSGSYRDEMHERYLELVSTDNPNAKPKSQWTAEDWRVYNYEQDTQNNTTGEIKNE